MIKKETLKAYIDGVQHQHDCDDKLHDALKSIHGDNYYISFVSDKYTQAMEELVEEFIGETASEWLLWWMWETNVGIGKNVHGVDPHIFVDDELVHNLDSFDKLYDYLTTLNDELI